VKSIVLTVFLLLPFWCTAAATGTLLVETEPTGAEAVLDPGTPREQRCYTPCIFNDVPTGEHLIEFHKETYEVKTLRWGVVSGARKVAVALAMPEKKKEEETKKLVQALEKATQKEHDLRNAGVTFMTTQISLPIIGGEIEFFRLKYRYFQWAAGSFRVGLTADMRVYYGFSSFWLGARKTFGEKNEFEIGFLTSTLPLLSGTRYAVHGLKSSQVSAHTQGAWFYTKLYFRYSWQSVCIETGLQFPLLWYSKYSYPKERDHPAITSANDMSKIKDLLSLFYIDYGDGLTEKYHYYRGSVPPIFLYLGVGF
jgi:hypothetical protein